MDINYIKYINANINHDFEDESLYQTNGLIFGLKYLYQTLINYFTNAECPQYEILQNNISKFDKEYKNNEYTETFNIKMKEIITNIINKNDFENNVKLYRTFASYIGYIYYSSDFNGKFFDDQNINFGEQYADINFYKPDACNECVKNYNKFSSEKIYTIFEDINIIIKYLSEIALIEEYFDIINNNYVLKKDLTIDDFRLKKYDKLMYKWKLNKGSIYVEQKIDEVTGYKYNDINHPTICSSVTETNVFMFYNSLLIKSGSILLDKELINNIIFINKNLWQPISSVTLEPNTAYITDYRENLDETYMSPNSLSYISKNNEENKLSCYVYDPSIAGSAYDIPNENNCIKYSVFNYDYFKYKKVIINKDTNYEYMIPVIYEEGEETPDLNKMNKILNSLSNQYYCFFNGENLTDMYYVNYVKDNNVFVPGYYGYIIINKPKIQLDDGEIIEGKLLKDELINSESPFFGKIELINGELVIYEWLPRLYNINYTIVDNDDDSSDNNITSENQSLININISEIPVKFNNMLLVKDFNQLMLRKCFPDNFKDKLILSEDILNEIKGSKYNINQRKIKEAMYEFGKYPLLLEKYFMNSSVNYKLHGLFQLKCRCKLSNLPKEINYLDPKELTFIENEVVVQGENMIIKNNKIISSNPVYLVGIEISNNKILNVQKIRIKNPQMLLVLDFQQFTNLYSYIELYIDNYNTKDLYICELTNATYGTLKNQKYITQF